MPGFEAMQEDCAARGCRLAILPVIDQHAQPLGSQLAHIRPGQWMTFDEPVSDPYDAYLERIDTWRRGLH